MRPVVRLERHLGLAAVARERFHEVVRPGVAVAHLRAAQGVQVVQRGRAVLGNPQRPVAGEPRVHLGGSFGAGRHLELHGHAVDGARLARRRDDIVRREVGDGARGLPHADADGQLAGGRGFQERAVLVARAAPHGVASVHVLGHGMLGEALRHDDGDGALGDLLFGHDALDAAVVVHVGVAHHDAHHRALAQVVGDQLERGARALAAHQRIEHDPARIAADEGDVRHVVAAHLIDAVHDFEQAEEVVDLGVAPEAGVGGVGRIGGGVGAVEERVGLLAPHHLAVFAGDLQRIGCGDEPALGEFALGFVGEVEQGVHALVGRRGCRRGRFRVGFQVVERGFAGGRVVTGSGSCGSAAAQGASRSHERAGGERPGHERAPVKCMMMAGHRAPPLSSQSLSVRSNGALSRYAHRNSENIGRYEGFPEVPPIAFAMLSTIEAPYAKKDGSNPWTKKPPSTARSC